MGTRPGKLPEIPLLKEIWSSTPKPLRRAAATMTAVGAIFLTLGIIGDAQGWFSPTPFLAGVLSGATIALFGFPLVLVFLQWLTSLQSRALRERSIVRLRAGFVAKFQTTVLSPIKTGMVDDLEVLKEPCKEVTNSWAALDGVLSELYKVNMDASNGRMASNQPYDDSDLARSAKELTKQYAAALQTASNAAGKVLEPPIENWRTRMETQWETMASGLRNESLMIGAEWIPAELESGLESLMNTVRLDRIYQPYDVSQTVDTIRELMDKPLTREISSTLASKIYPLPDMETHIEDFKSLARRTATVVELLSKA